MPYGKVHVGRYGISRMDVHRSSNVMITSLLHERSKGPKCQTIVQHQALLLLSAAHGAEELLISRDRHGEKPSSLLPIEASAKVDRTVLSSIRAEKKSPSNHDDGLGGDMVHDGSNLEVSRVDRDGDGSATISVTLSGADRVRTRSRGGDGFVEEHGGEGVILDGLEALGPESLLGDFSGGSASLHFLVASESVKRD